MAGKAFSDAEREQDVTSRSVGVRHQSQCETVAWGVTPLSQWVSHSAEVGYEQRVSHSSDCEQGVSHSDTLVGVRHGVSHPGGVTLAFDMLL